MSLKENKKRTLLMNDHYRIQNMRIINFLLAMMFVMQLILPIVAIADASKNQNDAIEPNIEEVQEEDNIELPISFMQSNADEDDGSASEETAPTSPETPTEVEEETPPTENVVTEPVEEPEPVANDPPPAPKEPVVKEPTAPATKPEQVTKPEEEQEEKQETEPELALEEVEIGERIDLMLDGFPATPHPANPTQIIQYVPRSAESSKVNSRMMQSNSTLAPGEVRTSKTATAVPGMVNTWDIKVRIEGRDNDVVETTDVVLVLDRSGSMSGPRLDNLKIAANNFIDQTIPFDTNLNIAIVSYSSDYTETSYPWRTSPLVTVNHGFSKNAGTLKTAIGNLIALGGTHTQAGIVQGRALFNNPVSVADNKYIILLSDGLPTYSYAPTNWDDTTTWEGKYPGGWPGLTGQGTRTNTFANYNGSYNTSSVVGTGSELTQSYNSGSTNRRHIHNGFAAIKAGQDARVGIDRLYTIGIQLDATTADIMSQIASPNSAYLANQPSELPGLYNEIRTEIMKQYALRNVTLVDEMGDGFSLIGGSLSTTEGTTAVVNATGTKNDTITWTLDSVLQNLVPGTTDVRYAEMTYRVQINDNILSLAGAKTDQNALFDTNKVTELRYKDITDTNQIKNITSPKVDPVLLKMKKILPDAAPTEARQFNVEVKRRTTGFNHTQALVPNADYVWLTTLRQEGTYDVLEKSITGTGVTDLNQFVKSYVIDGVANSTSFVVNHINNKPRGDITIDVTNREILKTQVRATKIWEGTNASEFTQIPLTLWRTVDGTTFEKITNVTPTIVQGSTQIANQRIYNYTWSNLNDRDTLGRSYTYYFTEDTVPGGYEREYLDTTVSGVINGATITFALAGGRVRNREMRTNITVYKVNDVEQPLTGAVFTLHRHSGSASELVVRLGNTNPISTFTFNNLTKGTYTLTEESAPDGFILPNKQTWTFEVKWSDTENKLIIEFADGDEIENNTIKNYPKGMLPDTGGPGNISSMIVSMFTLILLAALSAWRFKRNEVYSND